MESRDQPDSALSGTEGDRVTELTLESWIQAGNRHLFTFIRSQASHRVHYCSNAVRAGAAIDLLTRELTGWIVGYKNAWAVDMHEWPNPTPAEQREAWEACMARAETRCREIRLRDPP
jgi:hypothetical protein